MFKAICSPHLSLGQHTLHRCNNSTRSTARHVQLVTELYLYRLCIFNKIEVSRLDSTLSVFVIIRTIQTLSQLNTLFRKGKKNCDKVQMDEPQRQIYIQNFRRPPRSDPILSYLHPFFAKKCPCWRLATP